MIKEFKAKVLEIDGSTQDVRLIKLSYPEGFQFKAGQYISISVKDKNIKIRRPYSIASSPLKKNCIELCVKNVNGLATNYLFGLEKNDEVEFLGPMGGFILDKSSKMKGIIFIAVGTGIAPFMSMIPYLLESGYKKRIILIKGERKEKNMIYDEELSKLNQKYKNFEFYNVLSQPVDINFGNKGYVQNFLNKYIPENFEGDFYICGLSGMIKEVIKNLKGKGIPGKKIFYEKYD